MWVKAQYVVVGFVVQQFIFYKIWVCTFSDFYFFLILPKKIKSFETIMTQKDVTLYYYVEIYLNNLL
jgi:hypothetical protein